MTVFVVLDCKVTESSVTSISTEPKLDIVHYEAHFKEGKLYSLTLCVNSGPDLLKGNPITIIIGE
jgi:hypothetical protein